MYVHRRNLQSSVTTDYMLSVTASDSRVLFQSTSMSVPKEFLLMLFLCASFTPCKKDLGYMVQVVSASDNGVLF